MKTSEKRYHEHRSKIVDGKIIQFNTNSLQSLEYCKNNNIPFIGIFKIDTMYLVWYDCSYMNINFNDESLFLRLCGELLPYHKGEENLMGFSKTLNKGGLYCLGKDEAHSAANTLYHILLDYRVGELEATV